MNQEEFDEMMRSGLDLVMNEICEVVDGEVDYIFEELVTLRLRGFWSRIHCRIGSGREAFVYHATDSEHRELAIKVFTCSDYDLWSRFDYTAEYEPAQIGFFDRPLSERFAYSKIKQLGYGISCPSPVVDHNHVVIAEFIGKAGVPAPTLSVASAQLSKAQLGECFKEMVRIMRTLCQTCELVHGDLSETNVLYHQDHLYVIDCSQSVTIDHIYAPTLLNNDCCRVFKFFETCDIPVMPPHVLYRLVSDKSIKDDSFNSCLDETLLDPRAIERWMKLFEETPVETVLPEYNASVAQLKEQKRVVEAMIAAFPDDSAKLGGGYLVEDYWKYDRSSTEGDHASGASSAVLSRKRGRESPGEEAEDCLQGTQA